MAYASSAPVPHDAFAPAVSARLPSRSRPGLWRRFCQAFVTSRQRQADREIARYLETIGGTLTDHAEREIERRYLANRPS